MNTPTKTQVYNLVILDKSGSMESIRTEAINGYNETLKKKIADVEDAAVLVTIITDGYENSSKEWDGFNKVPSRFIREIKEGLLVSEGHMDKDLHEHFGNGIIRNIYDGGEYCEVQFFDSGTRSLKADKLKKA